MPAEVEFLPMKRVVQLVGLSQSEIYRRIKQGQFPASRAYRGASTRRFWMSTEVHAWQRDQVGDDFDALLFL